MLFNSQKRAKQETNGEQRLSIKGTHLLGDVEDPKDIKQGKQETVEQCQDTFGSTQSSQSKLATPQEHVIMSSERAFSLVTGAGRSWI